MESPRPEFGQGTGTNTSVFARSGIANDHKESALNAVQMVHLQQRSATYHHAGEFAKSVGRVPPTKSPKGLPAAPGWFLGSCLSK